MIHWLWLLPVAALGALVGFVACSLLVFASTQGRYEGRPERDLCENVRVLDRETPG